MFARLRRNLPSIDSDKAAHDWTPTSEDDPTAFGGSRDWWFCPTCEKQIWRTAGVAPPATGCARPRFTGRYERGDHVDAHGMRYTFAHYEGRNRAQLTSLSGSPICDLVDCSPVLSGRAESEKRRLAYLDRIGQ